MIDAKLNAILSLLEPQDRIPDGNGRYTVSYTTYGSSSLSAGGTYYDKANNLRLSETLGGRPGIIEAAFWPGVYSIAFDPEAADNGTADALISMLEDMRLSGGYPCLDEDLAASLEWDDKTAAVEEALDDMAFRGELILPDGWTVKRILMAVTAKLDERGDVLITEPGPSVYRDEDRFGKLVPAIVAAIIREAGV